MGDLGSSWWQVPSALRISALESSGPVIRLA